nr:MAG: hypothetical protein [Microvirus sp.]
MYIRNIYNKPKNFISSSLNPVSLTEPDDSLTVKDLFIRYMDGSLERSKRALERKQEFDGYNPELDMDLGPEDGLDLYERYYTDEPEKEVKEKETNVDDSNKDPEPDLEPPAESVTDSKGSD